MNVTKLNVVLSTPVKKVSKAGKPFEFLTIGGLATFEDGTQSMFTYDLWPERDKPLPVIPLGDCVPVYGTRVHWETSKLEPAFIGFRSIPQPAPAK